MMGFDIDLKKLDGNMDANVVSLNENMKKKVSKRYKKAVI